MTESPPLPELHGLQIERAPAPVVLTQAGRLAVPLKLRHPTSTSLLPNADLVLTAEAAEALCGEIGALLRPAGEADYP